MFANCRSQFLLDRLGRCLKLFVSTDSISSQGFASQFRLALFYTRKTPKTAPKPCRLHECLFQWTSDRPRKGAVIASRLVASDPPNSYNLNSDNCGHSGDRLRQNGEKAIGQNVDNESLYIHGLNNLAYELLCSPCV